jgi:formate/nitrite transporter FocA (FNT family)
MSNEFHLDEEEREQAHRLEGLPTSVIFEAIRREGERELSRTVRALWWSGVAAGLAISTSVLCKGFLVAALPAAEWTPAVSNLGYTVGFLIVILGRLQLFTENTITPILPLFLTPTGDCLARTARLWSIVFVANMVGCLGAAAVLVTSNLVPEAQFAGILAVSRHYAEATALEHLTWGIPAGFLIASLVWVLPRLEGTGEVLMIVILTYMIGLGGLSHVVAGATELFILMLRGEISVAQALLGGVLPAFVGNVIGGTGIFAALTYAQVRDEI